MLRAALVRRLIALAELRATCPLQPAGGPEAPRALRDPVVGLLQPEDAHPLLNRGRAAVERLRAFCGGHRGVQAPELPVLGWGPAAAARAVRHGRPPPGAPRLRGTPPRRSRTRPSAARIAGTASAGSGRTARAGRLCRTGAHVGCSSSSHRPPGRGRGWCVPGRGYRCAPGGSGRRRSSPALPTVTAAAAELQPEAVMPRPEDRLPAVQADQAAERPSTLHRV